jgi:hypothetical protein
MRLLHLQALTPTQMDPAQCVSILQPHLHAACAAAQMSYASSSSSADDGNSRELDLAAPSDTSLECDSPRPPPGALSLGRAWGPEDVIGACRTTVLRGESDVTGTSLAIIGCHEASVYVLAPLQHILVSCCVDCTIVVCSSPLRCAAWLCKCQAAICCDVHCPVFGLCILCTLCNGKCDQLEGMVVWITGCLMLVTAGGHAGGCLREFAEDRTVRAHAHGGCISSDNHSELPGQHNAFGMQHTAAACWGQSLHPAGPVQHRL